MEEKITEYIANKIGYGNTSYINPKETADQICHFFPEYSKRRPELEKALQIMQLDELASYVHHVDCKGVYITDIGNMCGNYTLLPSPVDAVFHEATLVLQKAIKVADKNMVTPLKKLLFDLC